MPDTTAGDYAWLDISVDNANELKSFYQKVLGWKAEDISMGEYNDYSMNNPNSNEPVAGICHAKGYNEKMPPVWLPYFLVDNVEQALADALEMGAEQLDSVKGLGKDKFVVIKDPAGASFALYQRG